MAKGFVKKALSPREEKEAKLLKRSVLKNFKHLEDPRVARTRQHNLVDIVTVSLLAVLCGADGCVAIETYGLALQSWLERFLELPNGIPSHDTIGRVLGLLDRLDHGSWDFSVGLQS
ncbi:transposase family protein [Moorena sp. SIO3I6]|uniref:transposase family protein n=1 Tax=Moorena sp. SIO3I6 TaxID=2607831 RepID=UPI0013FA3EF3|nr:transposase family protein [Moorena sp. SIO3I6]NEP28222.1 transposase family protein [Moorena sp. SIO3I6]